MTKPFGFEELRVWRKEDNCGGRYWLSSLLGVGSTKKSSPDRLWKD